MDNNRILVAAAVGIVAFLGWRTFFPKSTFAADGIDPAWDRQVAISQATNRPALVLFTASWCGACRNLHENVLSRSEVRQAIYEKYTFVTVDMTEPSQATMQRAEKCGVNAYPTLIRFDADGRESDRTHGMSPDAMIAWLGE